MTDFLVSPLVEQQLPSFIRDDYPTFVKFLQKYYEWMEQSGNVIDAANSLRHAQDIDLADEYFIELIRRDFLPFFPEEIRFDKRKFLKLVNQFYQSKGTPLSAQFLFRAIFNEEITITYPKEQILIASDGKWVLPLALRIDTDDNNIFNIEKTLITGQISKATAVVEQVTKSVDRQLGISYIELYVSNVDKLFQTGETISATYNNGTVDVIVTGRLIGALSEIKIDANNRGLFYNAYDVATGYPGDPVTIVGGLNPNSNTPIGAIAYVGETTKGAITDVVVTNGGFGFRNPLTEPNTSIVDYIGGFQGAVFGTEAKSSISLIDDLVYRTMQVSNTTIETVLTETLDQFCPTGNVQNCSVSNTSSYQSFNVYPISFVTVDGSGGGYRNRPDVDVYSLYLEENDDVLIPGTFNVVKSRNFITSSSTDFTSWVEVGDYVRLFFNNKYEEILIVQDVSATTLTFNKTFENDITGISIYHILRSDLRQLGSLGRIQIVNGGDDYQVGEYLIFTGGSGYGANAVITSVHSGNNGIQSVQFMQTGDCVIGGEAYSSTSLPTITVNTASGTGADLRVLEISGDGESLNLTTTRIGSISKLRVVSYGYDYVSAPVISLRNADILTSNITEGTVFVSNTRVYQGTSNTTATFSGFVDNYNSDTGLLRVFDYKGTFDLNKTIKSDDDIISASVVSSTFYGDGRAKATAKFENGLIRLPGLYLNTDGQVSADKVLQDHDKYHNFSYVINTTNDMSKFKIAYREIVAPIGTQLLVNRIETVTNKITTTESNYELIETTLPVTFNVSNGANNMVSTNNSYDLTEYIGVGDLVTLLSVSKRISGTVNVVSGSNTIIGTGTNFINDLLDGDTIYVQTGNTETLISVIDSNTAWTQNNFGVTSNNQTIDVVFNDTKIVNFVNANTILVDTVFTTNTNYVNVMSRIVT